MKIVNFKYVPKGWEKVKISEKLFFQEGPGVRRWQFTKEGIKLLNVGNINNGKIDLSTTDKHLSFEEATGKYKHFLIDEGDLLIACSGIVVDNFHNKIAFAKKEHLPLCLNTSTMRFRPLEDDVDLNYFKYFLQTLHFSSQLQKLITGSAQLNFGPSHIKKIDFLNPPLKTQKQIANILDNAVALRDKTQQLLREYDLLAQSIFLEMFGENKDFKQVKLGKLIKLIGGGTPSKKNENYWNGNIPWASVKDLKSDKLSKTVDKITIEGVENSSTKIIPKGSLIIATRMAVGRTTICEIDVAINQDLKAVKIIGDIKNEYLQWLLKSRKNYFDYVSSGATVKGIKIQDITELKVPLPPIALQTKFAEKIFLIEEQKALAKQELEESEDLFNCLLQKAFKGELV